MNNPFFEYAAISTLLILLVTFVLIYRNTVQPVKGLFIASILLLANGSIEVSEILSGFANPSIASIILLIVIAATLNRHFQLAVIFNRFIISSKGYRPFLGSMMFFAAITSSIMNNTAVVAMMTSYVYDWSIKHQISPSKVMMPLSFAAILGGMITVIGTSTTLLLNGFLGDAGLPGLNVFALLLIGLTVTLAGVLYFVLLGQYSLPDRPDLLKNINDNQIKYLAEVKVSGDSPLVGDSVSKGGLRNLQDFYLVEIIRDQQVISPVQPDEVIKEGDLLLFAGDMDEIKSLMTSDFGFVLPDGTELIPPLSKISEVVISFNSSLVGNSIKKSGFRSRYDAAVLAIHRNGAKLKGKLGKITLHAGDVLLVSAGPQFEEKADVYKDIYILSTELPVQRRIKKWPLVILLAVVLGFLFTNMLSLLTALLVLFGILFLMNMINLQTLKRELDINLIGILVLSLAIGKAVINSGAGEILSNMLIDAFSAFGPPGLLLALLLMTALLTSFVTNVAAVSIAFPVAFELGNIYPEFSSQFFLGIAFAASAAFLTPISYQTNLIVSGPGGYKFSDFTKAGLPLFILYLAIAYFALLLF